MHEIVDFGRFLMDISMTLLVVYVIDFFEILQVSNILIQ